MNNETESQQPIEQSAASADPQAAPPEQGDSPPAPSPVQAPPEEQMLRKPRGRSPQPATVGRIVHFHTVAPKTDDAIVEAAIITAVNEDESVNLTVLPSMGTPVCRGHVHYDDDGQPGCWNWPQRV